MKNYIVRLDSAYENSDAWYKAFVSNNKTNDYLYMDPDNSSVLLYRDLACFLNKREKQVERLNGKFSYELSFDPFGIKVTDDTKDVWYLKSDQLGFSAIGGIYQTYIEKAPDREEALRQVSQCIFVSRSLGGSFLWPMDKKEDGGWISNPQYNKTRGRKPIQDRVDMTLLDIRNCFFETKGSWLLKQYNNRQYMKKWMDHFIDPEGEPSRRPESGFEKYIEYFCFDSFVSKFVSKQKHRYPKDLLGKESTIKDFWDSQHKTSLCDYDYKEIETIFSNLKDWITDRSNEMEKIINLP